MSEKKWSILFSVFMMALSVSALSQTRITLVNHVAKGDYIHAYELVLSELDAFWSSLTQNTCNCRKICWSLTECLAFSTEPVEGQVLCRLAKKGPQNSTLEPKSKGVYNFWTKSIDSRVYRTESDGLLYLVPKFIANYTAAKSFCQKFPGHRLGMYHSFTRQQALNNIYSELGQEILVDLLYSDGVIIWGDGTLARDTEVYSNVTFWTDVGEVDRVFRLNKRSNYNDFGLHFVRRFACQANPNGLAL